MAGKIFEAAILDRFQVDVANLENISDMAKFIADSQARGFQERTDAGGSFFVRPFLPVQDNPYGLFTNLPKLIAE